MTSTPAPSAREIAVLAIFFFVGACASKPEGAARGVSVVVDGETRFSGPAAFTVREAAHHTVERVVSFPRVGELIVDVDRCRFVRSDHGLQALAILESPPCAEQRGDRLCFSAARFGPSGQGVVVDGCADQNELFLDRVTGAEEATLGPRTLVERCAPVPAKDLRYVRVDDIAVDDVENPRRGLRLRWNGDGFDVCFLSKKQGRYRLELVVDDGGKEAAAVVAGDVTDF